MADAESRHASTASLPAPRPVLSLDPPADAAPTLVIAIGNPSRGDDALGPQTAEYLAALGLPGVEVMTDFQLQVEHALDLLGRRRVVFVDASVAIDAPFTLARLAPAPADGVSTHALAPSAVLHAYRQLTGQPVPDAWLLAIRGHRFELGEPLSEAARQHLALALDALRMALRTPLHEPLAPTM